MTYPMVSENSDKQARYEKLMRISRGNHRYAMRMISGDLFPVPGTCTDREFFAGRGTLGDQFEGDDQTLEHITSVAQRNGYKPGANDVYTPALADYPGDPAAFVPPDGGRGHIRRVCESRGEGCRGLVNVKPVQYDPTPDTGPPIAEDLIQNGVNDAIREDPSLAAKRQEVRENFIERHAPTE